MAGRPTDAVRRKYLSVFEVSMDSADAWNATLDAFGPEVMAELELSDLDDVQDEVYERLGLVTNARWSEWLEEAARDAASYGADAAVGLHAEDPDVDVEEEGFWADYATPDYVQEEADDLGGDFAHGKPGAEDVAGWAASEYSDTWDEAMFGAFYEKMEELQA